MKILFIKAHNKSFSYSLFPPGHQHQAVIRGLSFISDKLFPPTLRAPFLRLSGSAEWSEITDAGQLTDACQAPPPGPWQPPLLPEHA